jgi:hypothetical protein
VNTSYLLFLQAQFDFFFPEMEWEGECGPDSQRNGKEQEKIETQNIPYNEK